MPADGSVCIPFLLLNAMPSSGSTGGCLAREGAQYRRHSQRGPGKTRSWERPCRSPVLTVPPRPSKWSPAPRPRTSARTSPPGCSSSPQRDSASLSKLQTRWVLHHLRHLCQGGRFAGAIRTYGQQREDRGTRGERGRGHWHLAIFFHPLHGVAAPSSLSSEALHMAQTLLGACAQVLCVLDTPDPHPAPTHILSGFALTGP